MSLDDLRGRDARDLLLAVLCLSVVLALVVVALADWVAG
jgi:lipopolysaccharide export LptBFGC system permease protein LptF